MANINRMTLLMSISEITPQLFISGQMAATLEQVHRLGITYILNVAVESSPIVYPKHIKLEKFDIIDFPTAPISIYFNTLTDKIHAHLNANKHHKVLVHCMAGISRSTTIVCAYLMRYMHLTLRDAYLLCKQHRPICFPNLGFWAQLIAYEYQLRKENSVKMVPTQFGQVPDVALEELKQMRQQQQQQQQQPTVPIPFHPPTFASSITNTNNNSIHTLNEPLPVTSTKARITARDISNNNLNSTTRSRSLAPNPTGRPSIVAASTNISHPAYQTPLFTTNKQTLLNPTRFDPRRLQQTTTVPTANLPATIPVPSSMSFSSTRSLPTYKSSRNKGTINSFPSSPRQALAGVAAPVTARPVIASTQPKPQRPHYETTYRSSYIKPIVP